ncbi:MAG: hemolysin family protein [Armatimonadota bacterium]|jgi:putative hemolysin
MIAHMFILLALILTNGVFAMAEIAVVSARPTRLRQMAERGSSGARMALDLARSPGRFLATIQIGITLVGVGAGAFGEATLSRHLEPSLAEMPVVGAHSQAAAAIIVVLCITYLTLVIGELAPKNLALSYSESISAMVAPLMKALSVIACPVVWLLNHSERLVTAPFRHGREAAEGINRDEIMMLMDEWSEAGILNEVERELADGLLDLGDRPIESILKPRPDVHWLDAEIGAEELREELERTHYSVLPVAEGSLDRVIGTVSARELLVALLREEEPDLHERVERPVFIASSASALDLLGAFGSRHTHMAIALDEHGIPEGIVTLTDLMQAIVGPLAPLSGEYDSRVQEIEPGRWVVDAMVSLDDFEERLGIEIPIADRAHFQTVAGLVLNLLEDIPEEGETVRYENFTLRVERMEGRRIDQVTVARESS